MANRSLHGFVEDVTGQSHLRVEHDFGDGYVRLETSEAERRQAAQDIQCSEDIVLELLRNSRDAHATHVFMAVSKEGAKRFITIIDDGDGIPPAMHETVFEPRVTSKLDSSHMDAWGLHGRGMALYSISQNTLSAHVACSDAGLGCSISIVSNTGKLSEKSDQSSFPRFLLGGGGNVSVRGPKNILRTACEFAIESRDSCSVYVGSPAEIASALHAYGVSALSAIDRAFCKDVRSLPIVKRLATASDPADFSQLADGMGLQLSSRTARRVLDGEIEEAPSLLDRISIEDPSRTGKSKSKSGINGADRHRRVKIQRADSDLLADSVGRAFVEIADRYYLVGSVEPKVRVMRDRITITLPLVEKQ